MLEIRGLHAGYAARVVLRGVDLRVARGEVVALAGPNGCGKTTLLRAISGVHRSTAGEIWLDGQSINCASAANLARRIAVLPQGGTLPERYTAFEVAMMGRTPHLGLLQSESTHDVAVVRGAMERVDCWQLRSRFVDELSGGERQRVVLSRALAQEPELLLLDEPTSHLDLAHQVDTFTLVRTLCRERRMAVLAVVHDLTLAATFADRVALMSNGRILGEGAPRDVLTQQTIAEVYGTRVRVLSHPVTGRPVIVPDGGMDADVCAPEVAESIGAAS